jgi:hypothetical protein
MGNVSVSSVVGEDADLRSDLEEVALSDLPSDFPSDFRSALLLLLLLVRLSVLSDLLLSDLDLLSAFSIRAVTDL